MELTRYNIFHFIPKESFNENQETFIWTDVCYCNKNDIVAVDCCYWEYPASSDFFDFSNPEKLPYKMIYSSYDMEGEINIDSDVILLRWN